MAVRSVIVPKNIESSDHLHPGSVNRDYDHAVPAMRPLRVPLGTSVAAHNDGNLDVHPHMYIRHTRTILIDNEDERRSNGKQATHGKPGTY